MRRFVTALLLCAPMFCIGCTVDSSGRNGSQAVEFSPGSSQPIRQAFDGRYNYGDYLEGRTAR